MTRPPIGVGRQAVDLGLVDEIGGLGRAIELVLQAAGHDPGASAELEFYPRPPSFFELLGEGLSPFLSIGSRSFPVLPVLRKPQALELPPELLQLLLPSSESDPPTVRFPDF